MVLENMTRSLPVPELSQHLPTAEAGPYTLRLAPTCSVTLREG